MIRAKVFKSYDETFVPAAVANTVGQVANVPVFAMMDMHIKQGWLAAPYSLVYHQ